MQLCLSAGIPTLAVLAGILINAMMLHAQGQGINSLGQRITGLDTSLSSRLERIETKLNRLMAYLMEHRS